MKIGETVLAWVITVLLGSAVCTFFAGKEIQLIVFFIVLSGLTSLPYLIIYSIAARKITNFVYLQLLHGLLAFLTAFVILIFSRQSEILYVVAAYFAIGIIVHAIIFYRKPLTERPNIDSDILDN
jgi:hypothetical protein